MPLEKTFKLKGMKESCYPIVQGGMGVYISGKELAAAVAKEGCIGTISSAGLDQLVVKALKMKNRISNAEAAEIGVSEAKELSSGGVVAINIMVALKESYEGSVIGAVKGGVDMIISGAGIPRNLPEIVKNLKGTHDHGVNLVPMVSSDKVFDLMCQLWERKGYRPDAVVLEGPKAGGHLGWNYGQIKEAGDRFLEEYDLFEKLLPPVLDIARKYPNDFGPIPVIVAGGIFTHEDIVYALNQGASAVQMATRFAVTKESGGTELFKKSLLNAAKDDIVVATEDWGSACKYPFRYLKTSPLFGERKGEYFCICATLLGAMGVNKNEEMKNAGCPEGYVGKNCPARGNVNYSPLFTCGSDAYRLKEILKDRDDKIISTKELIKELVG